MAALDQESSPYHASHSCLVCFLHCQRYSTGTAAALRRPLFLVPVGVVIASSNSVSEASGHLFGALRVLPLVEQMPVAWFLFGVAILIDSCSLPMVLLF